MGAPRLGGDFHRLWTAGSISNIGDGVALAAGPLLLASMTSDPALVAGALFVQQLPWLLFSLPAGVLVDRWDRRRIVVLANLVRAAAVAGLTVAVATGQAGVAIVYATLFVLGTLETLADNAASSLIPSVVEPEQLPRANARLYASTIVLNQLVAPPLGAALFVVAAAIPFGMNAASFALSAALIATLRVASSADRTGAPTRGSMRRDIATGMRSLLHHPVLRMLAVCLCFMNVTLMAAFGILVLYARERLGLDEIGYGVLLASLAAGGLIGTATAAWLQARFGASALVRAGLVIETCTHLSLALVTAPWAAMATLVVFGAHGSVLGVIITSWRQRVVPDVLRGRVNSGYFLFSIGGSAIGALAGGFVARWLGITSPFWIAFAGMVVLTAVAWRAFSPSLMNDPAPVKMAAE
ncbi:MFS transporter [Actinomycetes bacterium KLBMP 9759]